MGLKAGERLDRALYLYLRERGEPVSIRELKKALLEKHILINGKPARPGQSVVGDERIDLQGFVPAASARLAPQPELAARIPRIFEDDTLLVLDKPSGIPTQPLKSDEQDTLLNAAIAIDARIASAGPPLEGGLVHRLDRGTSGIVLFAKTPSLRAELRERFSRREIAKRYLALSGGSTRRLQRGPQRVDAPLIAQNPRRMRIARDGEPKAQPARSEVHLVQAGALSLLEVRTSTGRRHQVRVHLASIGLPILGDEIYAPEHASLRLALHASALSLPDGRHFESELPEDLAGLLSAG